MRPDISPKTHIARRKKVGRLYFQSGFFGKALIFLLKHLFGALVLADLILSALCLVWWNDLRAYSMDNLQFMRISDYQAYVTYSKNIVIKTENKEFFLDRLLLPDEMKLENVNKQLGQTTSASLWVEKGTVFIKGIETQHVTIPPSHGIEWMRQDGRIGLWIAIFLIVLGICGYFAFKRRFDLDWKLGFKEYKKKGRQSDSEPTS